MSCPEFRDRQAHALATGFPQSVDFLKINPIAPNAKGGRVIHPDVSCSHAFLSYSDRIAAKANPHY